jgi:hypothetical protein
MWSLRLSTLSPPGRHGCAGSNRIIDLQRRVHPLERAANANHIVEKYESDMRTYMVGSNLWDLSRGMEAGAGRVVLPTGREL